MRILVVANQWYPDFLGGTARVVTATSTGLARRGHDVTAIVPAVSGMPQVETLEGVRLERVIKRFHLPQTYVDVLGAYRGAMRSGRKPDLILAHDAGVAVGAAAAIRVPLVYVFHASAALEAEDRRERGLSPLELSRSLVTEPMMVWNERMAIRRASRVLVLSRFSEQLVVERHGSRAAVQVVTGGVDLHEFSGLDHQMSREQLGVKQQDLVLLTVRRLVARTGVGMLIDAFEEVARRHPNARLVVIGEGEDLSDLQARARRAGVDHMTRFLGAVDDQALRQWYAAADLFVLPTVSYEGFGMATAEALASGTPVVATPVGATPEVLAGSTAGMLSQSEKPSDFAAAINAALAKTPDVLRHEAAKFAAERLSWAKALDVWESALLSDELVARSSS